MPSEEHTRYMDGVFVTELKSIREIMERTEKGDREWREMVMQQEKATAFSIAELEKRVAGLERIKYVMHGAWALLVLLVKFWGTSVVKGKP